MVDTDGTPAEGSDKGESEWSEREKVSEKTKKGGSLFIFSGLVYTNRCHPSPLGY